MTAHFGSFQQDPYGGQGEFQALRRILALFQASLLIWRTREQNRLFRP